MNGCQKGKRGEREFAHWLKARGVQARRGQQFSGGEESPDVVADIDRVHLEIKRTENLRLHVALDQAKRDAPSDAIPTVLFRSNGRDWVAILEAKDWLDLLRQAGRLRGANLLE